MQGKQTLYHFILSLIGQVNCKDYRYLRVVSNHLELEQAKMFCFVLFCSEMVGLIIEMVKIQTEKKVKSGKDLCDQRHTRRHMRSVFEISKSMICRKTTMREGWRRFRNLSLNDIRDKHFGQKSSNIEVTEGNFGFCCCSQAHSRFLGLSPASK